MLRCGVDFIGLLKDVLANSGRGVLHRGHYEQCLENPHMKYSLIEMGMGDADLFASVGLCLPRKCSDSIVTGAINSSLKILGTDLNVLWINSDTENYKFSLFWVSYLTIFVIIAVIVLALISTVRGNGQNQNKYLKSFNIKSNLNHFDIRQAEDLNVWDGVRSIAMMWVILGHFFSFQLGIIDNITNAMYFANKPFILILQAGLFAVDVFFCLGGFFLAFIMVRGKITMKICGLGIVQRVLRIWPAFILTMMVYYSIFMRLGSGPLWSRNQQTCLNCSIMWRDMLFISNLTNYQSSEMCLHWSWYLMVDFQLFVVGVLLLYLYSIRKTMVYASIAAMSLFSTIFIFVYTLKNHAVITADFSEQAQDPFFFYYIYMSPYSRCIPYLMGLTLGIFYMEYRKEAKDKREEKVTVFARVKVVLQERNILRIGIEWLGIGLMSLVTFIPRPLQTGSHWPQLAHSLYFILSKPIFTFGLILTVLPSCLGLRHSFFALILNAKIFSWIARISFCTYLVHVLILYCYIFSRTYDVYYVPVDTFVIYFGLLVICLFFGFVLTIFVQLPFANLLKIMVENFKNNTRESQTLKKYQNQSLLTNESIITGNVKEPQK